MPAFKTLDGVPVRGKRVVVRCDFNVPMADGVVTDTTRIDRGSQTIRELAHKGARVIVISHFGRPKGQRVASMSLAPLVAPLAKALGQPVAFADDCVGPAVEMAVAALADGDVLLLENVRFHPGEEKNDLGLAQALAGLGHLYVNDAFSAAHRAHASTEAIAHLLPAYAGRLMQGELEALGKALEHPARPVVAIVGGAKVSTKLDLLSNLIEKVDVLVIGGGMANTFLFAQGKAIGKSLAEKDMAETARAIMAKAETLGHRIVLPSDGVVAAVFAANPLTHVVSVDAVPDDQMILDAGPASVAAIVAVLQTAKTLLWNGPLGAFELPPFDAATNAVAGEAARLTKAGSLVTVAGGGDTVGALSHAGVADDFTYISTAGGAFLEWLEGKTLPGIAALG